MLYLEDYLEMIEQLPMDLRERFTEIREMDLQVQNSMDNLEGRVKTFFDSCRKEKCEKKEQQYSGIRKDYYKTLEDANEKVQMANQIYEQVDRHLRKLDQELAKFKMELEADNAGITEILERRSLDLDKPIQSTGQHVISRGEKRKHHNTENHSEKKVQQSQEKLALVSVENCSSNISGGHSSSNSSVKSESKDPVSSSSSSSISYNLGTVGAASSNPLAMAAAQAVSNTLQMNQGRRTASFKASFEALRSVGFDPTIITKEFTIGTSPPSSTESTRSQRQRKQTAKAQALWEKHQAQQERHHQLQQLHQQQATPLSDAPDTPLVPPLPEDPSVPVEWSYDPNEPRYCICNQVSYGEMVGCDNPNCPIEWFHYGCVGILNPPKGKWYCPQCTASMKRREKKEMPPEKKEKKGH
ncbi:inhibitor of growth protein 3-like [Anneissia japonica]|uniref:inhibitor of growth protein 3-like n=1 Tax=Anneissia japonica TaxID=1529436 RepID=UPI0014259E02|nr:inhibitor of growth protein 3-like [Anneissia japonica]